MIRTNRLWEENISNEGCLMKIVEYNSSSDIVVEFIDDFKYKTKSNYANFKQGGIRNPYFKSVFNKGFCGVGKHKIRIQGKITHKYETWHDMIKRSSSKLLKDRYKTYQDVKVCKEWCNFQNFGNWYDENYYEISNNRNERMELDKDILIKGNKLYSPETCVFVPHNINTIFIKSDKARGEYPIGVNYFEQTDEFRARCGNSLLNKRISLGLHQTPEDAFYAYKQYKEKHIKEVANYYKDRIPKKLYDAMYKYKVEITD